jgi:hypothetical protein
MTTACRDRFNFNESRPSILENLSDIAPIESRRLAYAALHRSGGTMGDFWTNWMEAVRFTCEAQGVISARLMLFASGAPNAAEEATLMISEKIAAFADAGIAAERALADGLGLYVAAERAYSPLQRAVHANSGRLLHAFH